ncbi:MAG: electron transfer flavoprotein subunit alpha/FixB family protein [Desulfosalsimonadaceae bacterium]
MESYADIAVIAAHDRGRILPETYDVAAFALELQKHRNGAVRILALGAETGAIAAEIAGKTGQAVDAITCPELGQYCGEVYRRILADRFRGNLPAYILAANNSQGLDFAPALAATLESACITGVTGMRRQDSGLIFQKPAYGGKVKANVRAPAACCVLTLQPGTFRLDTEKRRPGPVTSKTVSCPMEHTRISGIRPAAGDSSAITEARVIIAAGNGLGEEENMELIHSLARLFAKSAVAGTRTVCDRGWLGYHQQVGVTGATVSPDLYIACGISGAVQHVMGMQGSGLVISINTDGRAAIFNESDFCIVEDLTRFIPLLLETYESRSDA